MPYHLSDWRGRIQAAVGEYRVAREGLDRLKVRMIADASSIPHPLAEHLERATFNLEGTYIIRVFAVFDATLRSFDRH